MCPSRTSSKGSWESLQTFGPNGRHAAPRHSSLLILRVLIAGTPRLLCKFRVYCVPLLLFFAGCLQLSSLHIFECFFAVCFRLLCSCFLIVTFLPLAVVLFVCLASCLLSCCLRPYGPLSRHVIKRHHLVRGRVSDRAPSPNEEAGEPPSPSEGWGEGGGLGNVIKRHRRMRSRFEKCDQASSRHVINWRVVKCGSRYVSH